MKERLLTRHRLSKGTLIVTVLFVCLLLLFIHLDASRVLRLQRDIDEQTQNYISDVAEAMANDIDQRMKTSLAQLRSLDDSLLQLDRSQKEKLEFYLTHQAMNQGFDGLAIIGAQGEVFSSDEIMRRECKSFDVTAPMRGVDSILFQENGDAVYAVPMWREDEIEAVLCGKRNKKAMQNVLHTNSFGGEVQNCITTLQGEVLVMPDSQDFQAVSRYFGDDSAMHSAEEIQADIQAKRSGVITFADNDGTKKMLSYTPLKMNNWILFSVIPTAVVSQKVENSMTRILILAACTIVLMVLEAVWLLVERYRRNLVMKKALMTDQLTGGNSNAAFQYKCRQALQRRQHGMCAIVVFDIKQFKMINLQYDSAEGDRILQRMMAALCEHVKGKGFAARSHADVFYAYMEAASKTEIIDFVGRVQAQLLREVEQFNRSLSNKLVLVVQPGVYIVEDPTMSITIMQDRARMACRNRTASEDGVCIFFDAAMLEQLKLEHSLQTSFESALQNHEFQLYLQPKVRTDSETIGGAEALVRWQHPQNGMIPPSRFIPLFEKDGNICELDFYMFEQVCKLLRRWLDEGRKVFPISINVSRRHFFQTDGFSRYGDIAAKYAIPAGLLELELTETVFLADQNIGRVEAVVGEMHRLGFRCSLDDFGSGYTSIYMLTELGIDVLKLDRCLFNAWMNPKARVLVELILDICRRFNIETVAEGIEERDKLDFLKQKKCDLIQGYIYAKPMPVGAFEEWMEKFCGGGQGFDACSPRKIAEDEHGFFQVDRHSGCA